VFAHFLIGSKLPEWLLIVGPAISEIWPFLFSKDIAFLDVYGEEVGSEERRAHKPGRVFKQAQQHVA
jgi:hypothetical protein